MPRTGIGSGTLRSVVEYGFWITGYLMALDERRAMKRHMVASASVLSCYRAVQPGLALPGLVASVMADLALPLRA